VSKKKRASKPEPEKEADYYKLKTQAVKDLVEANESNSPQVSKAELNKYRSKGRINLAQWVKFALIKVWFAGAVCFFFLWGLGGYMADLLDTLFITGIALGIVTDLLTNNVLRFFEKKKGEADSWMMITKKGYISFPLNILYAFVVLLAVFMFYSGVNLGISSITGNADKVYLGVEPVLFGLFCMGFDLLFIRIKLFILGLFNKKGSDAREVSR